MSKTNSKSVSKPKVSKSKTLVDKSKSKIKTTSVIQLLPNQLIPIRYLVSKCKNQHGLLINHMLGGGKTNIGVYLAKNYPDKKFVVLLPKGFENIWIDSANKIDVEIYKFVYYEDLQSFTKEKIENLTSIFNESILVADEAHNLLKIIESFSRPSDYFSEDYEEPKKKNYAGKYEDEKIKISNEQKSGLSGFLDTFKVAKKILLLTGTPIIDNITDIRWLINISAGKRVAPYNEIDFKKKYFKPEIVNGILNGWIQKILFSSFMGIKIFSNMYRINFTNIEYFQGELSSLIMKTLKDTGSYLDKINPSSFTKSLSLVGATSGKSWMDIVSDTSGKEILAGIILAAIVSKGLIITFTALKTIYEKNTYDTLEPKKLKDLSSYISFYSNEKSKDFPSIKIIKSPVKYTDFQLELWTRVVYGLNISDKESFDLGLNKNMTDAELFKPDYIHESKYVRNGRIIGNLAGKFSGKEKIPIKFQNILSIYKKTPVSTVVYSNFYEQGILLLSQFLTKNKIKHTIFTPFLSSKQRIEILEDFKNKKITFLLLHPLYFEGLSIPGARIFHILEPMDKYHKMKQLYARVSRYKGHSHLPINERNVVIYQWYCTLDKILDRARQYGASIKDWFYNNILIIYTARFADFDTNLGPDDTIINKIENIENKLNEFSKTMSKISIENTKIQVDCCVYGDTVCKNKPKCYT